MFLMAQGRQVTKTGPNNATGIVWAIVKFFFFFCVLFILIIIFRQGWGGLGEAAKMKIALKTGCMFFVVSVLCFMYYYFQVL